MTPTTARVNIIIQNNGTFQDAFQFGVTGDTTWSFSGRSFIMEVKASRDDAAARLQLTSAANEIIVDDPVQRVLHFNVSDTAIKAALPNAEYVYDLIMFDGSTPPIRTPLMGGCFTVTQGVTED